MAESEGVSKSFDPRFSRAFQPGYDERVHREEPPSVGRDEPRPQGTSAAGERDDSPMFAVPAADGTTGGTVERATGDGSADEDAAYPTPWWRRINPWFLLLWGLGAVFIVSGFGLVRVVSDLSLSNQFNGNEGYFLSMLYQMTWAGAPMLVVLGLATLTSTVVVQAARWRRRT